MNLRHCCRLKLISILVYMCIQNTEAQVNQNDSIIIRYLGATRITDSLNSPLPASIRKITVNFLLKNGKNPFEYFTYNLSQFSVYEESKVMFYYKIGALREIYDLDHSGLTLIGDPGEPGDAIFITYDKMLTKAIQLFGDE